MFASAQPTPLDARCRRRARGNRRRAPDGADGQGHYVDGPCISFAGGAELVSTARDSLMTTNQVDTLRGTGRGFGLGFETTEK